ncbi:MAG: LON peptidase substrate-binding domain-containing protein [Pseudomonadota bacterium]
MSDSSRDPDNDTADEQTVDKSQRRASSSLYPVLPLRNIVVFPRMIVPLFAGREKSVRALDDIMKNDKEIVVTAQRSEDVDNPEPKDLYEIGTIATVLQLLKLPDGTVKVLVEATRRVKVEEFFDGEDFIQARISYLEDTIEENDELQALIRSVVSNFEDYAKLDKKIPSDVLNNLSEITDPSKLADTISQYLTVKLEEKQKLLELVSPTGQLEAIHGMMQAEISVMNTEKRIRGRVKRQMEKTQREYYLNEQMKAIQKELGSSQDGQSEIEVR